jgi:hypothetical protein
MTGRLYIDGKDAYQEWGVYVTKDGYNELIAFPSLKSVDTNDWQEEDGVEPDLSDPKLDTHEVQVYLAASGAFSTFFTFLDFLSDGAYHIFDCRSIGRVYVLRLVSHPSYKMIRTLEKVTLKFADDFPLRDYTYQEPQSTMPDCEDYDIDEKLLSAYGIRVLQGTLDEIKRSAAVKQNLLRNIATESGAMYDGAKIYGQDTDGSQVVKDKNVRYKNKEVKLTCLMRAESLTGLWRNWDALLYDLIRPDERMLYCRDQEQTFPCYYKSCSVQEFYPDGRIWLKFTLTLVFFRDFRISDDFILCTEDGTPVCTEDDEYAIDLTPFK